MDEPNRIYRRAENPDQTAILELGSMASVTLEEALARDAPGWNIRCNLCGSHGARWIQNQRPGWGSLCLCPTHERELNEELARHTNAMIKFRTINFEQLPRSETDARWKAYRKGAHKLKEPA